MVVIETKELGRKFGALEAVKHLDLQVQQGEIFGFLGPNGAGKTTTIKMLCGLLPPTSGHGKVCGHDINSERGAIKRATGYMAQSFSLYPDLTVEENFRFFAGVYGIYGQACETRMSHLLERVDLAHKRKQQAGRLSGGLKQRLALACALVHKPMLVFLDEPTAGVDPSQRQKLWDLLYDLCEEGTTLFVTTHYLDEAERCHNVGFMLGGELIEHGPPATLRQRLQGRIVGVESHKAIEAMRALRVLPDVQDVTIYGYELRVFFAHQTSPAMVEDELRRAAELAGADVRRVYAVEPSLEDLFMSYARHTAAAELL